MSTMQPDDDGARREEFGATREEFGATHAGRLCLQV